MKSYKCVVYDTYNIRKVIKFNLESKNDIVEYANNNNLKIVSIKENQIIKKGNKLKDKEIKILCKEMSILLRSGCEFTKLLYILKKQSKRKISNLLSNISSYIQIGNSITESFQRTNIFSKFFMSIIKVGEVSGNLDKVMDNLSYYYSKEHTLKSKIKTILIYPIILIIISIISMLFVLTSIIPSFQTIFTNNNISPPLFTKILINISIFLKNNLRYVIISILMLNIFIFYTLKTNKKLTYLVNKLKIKVPFIKDITQLVTTTRFARTLSILTSSGIQIIDAINISAGVIDNNFIYERIMKASDSIKKGHKIGESLNLANVFPELFISMINIGEESGRLEESLNTINEFYENELDIKIQQSMKLVEPVITIIIGVIIGACIIAMVMPMFDAVMAV
ncbi:type II secretion system F family protein [Romboutsia maritimum]|uniref:Type II secretion system F family protein n=1 Tax=Romboutsia maritimum TaxID=2020948 RepID=A0A371IVC9_9FIRM|nr:type II secretion system F family protein [Romboutsia maritimum]RDY24443.1 type II secretion system F family protein [Romboutsia maritimum]